MAAALLVEEETGTFYGRHPHNGYYAGSFSQWSTSSPRSDEGTPSAS